MSFLSVFNALFAQLSTDSTLLTYIPVELFFKGDQEIPKQDAFIIFEPIIESEDPPTQSYGKVKDFIYDTYIWIGKWEWGPGETHIVGDDNVPGILTMVRDVKRSVRADLTLGYDQYGTSVSDAGVSTSYTLNNSLRYISVSINGREPTGYNVVDCGTATLTGTQIASNIQVALRALAVMRGDGYTDATCTYDLTTKKFTISSETRGAGSTVAVTAGASDDASVILGFDNPTETRGCQILEIEFLPTLIDWDRFPLVLSRLPVRIKEDQWVGAGV